MSWCGVSGLSWVECVVRWDVVGLGRIIGEWCWIGVGLGLVRVWLDRGEVV